MGNNWYIGWAWEREECLAEEKLIDQGFEVYLPKTHSLYLEGRKRRVLTDLRLPGYILIKADDDQNSGHFGAINNTAGMRAVDNTRRTLLGGPTPMKPEMVKFFRDMERTELSIARASGAQRKRSDLIVGDLVEINNPNDAFNGKRGNYRGSIRKKAIIQLGDLLKEVDLFDLKKIEQDARKAA